MNAYTSAPFSLCTLWSQELAKAAASISKNCSQVTTPHQKIVQLDYLSSAIKGHTVLCVRRNFPYKSCASECIR